MTPKPYQITVEHVMPTTEEYVPPPERRKPTRFERGFYSKEMFDSFMCKAAAFVDKYGFVSVRDKGFPTANRAWNALWSRFKSEDIKVKKRHRTMAEEAVKWAANLTKEDIKNSPYLGKIKNIAKGKYLNAETAPHAASIIQAYIKRVFQPTETTEEKTEKTHKPNKPSNKCCNLPLGLCKCIDIPGGKMLV